MADLDPCDHDLISLQMNPCKWIETYQCTGSSPINFYQFCYCDFTLTWEGYVIFFLLMILAILFMFYLIGLTAERWVAPALGKIAEIMHMSQNLAGVTFVALGNGAPDVIGAVVASGSTSPDGTNLAIGALIGSCLMLTHLVSFLVTFVTKGNIVPMKKALYLRDMGFLLLVVIVLGIFFFIKVFTWWVGLLFLCIYLLYLTTSIIMERVLLQDKKDDKEVADVDLDPNKTRVDRSDSVSAKLIPNEGVNSTKDNYMATTELPINEGDDNKDTPSILPTKKRSAWTMISAKLYLFRLIKEEEETSKMGFVSKIVYYIIKLPCNIIIQLTMFPVDEGDWDRRIATFAPVGAVTLCTLLFKCKLLNSVESKFCSWLQFALCFIPNSSSIDDSNLLYFKALPASSMVVRLPIHIFSYGNRMDLVICEYSG